MTIFKSSLTIFVKSFRQKDIWENIWKRNITLTNTNNFPTNEFWTYTLFSNYCQRYRRCRRQFLKHDWLINTHRNLLAWVLPVHWSADSVASGPYEELVSCDSTLTPAVIETKTSETQQKHNHNYLQLGDFNHLKHNKNTIIIIFTAGS